MLAINAGLIHFITRILQCSLISVALLGCTANQGSTNSGTSGIKVVTTTTIVADWVKQVAGDRVGVTSLVPANADPHGFAPGPKDVANVTNADLVLEVGLTLESAWLDKLLKNASADPSRIVALGDFIDPIPFQGQPLHAETGVEKVLFLGLNLKDVQKGVFERDEVALRLVEVRGPGQFLLYGTDEFGDPVTFFNTKDGITTADVMPLHPGSHVHANWVFTAEGAYTIAVQPEVSPKGSGTKAPGDIVRYTFLVGTQSRPLSALSVGHVALRMGYGNNRWSYDVYDEAFAGTYRPDGVTLVVPGEAKTTAPSDARFAFLGLAGTSLWVLPQGSEQSHEHGPNDPHFWWDPMRVKKVLPVIVQRLTQLDPSGADTYQANAEAYAKQLDEVYALAQKQLEVVPRERRTIVTSHEAFGYLASAFGFKLVGSVIPGGSTAREPSAADLSRLVNDIRSYKVPAVFTENILNDRLARRVADEAGVRIVTGLATDSLGAPGSDVDTYIGLVKHNVQVIADALKK